MVMDSGAGSAVFMSLTIHARVGLRKSGPCGSLHGSLAVSPVGSAGGAVERRPEALPAGAPERALLPRSRRKGPVHPERVRVVVPDAGNFETVLCVVHVSDSIMRESTYARRPPRAYRN